MIAGIVIGNVWATRKNESLSGYKLLVVKPINYADENQLTTPVIAVDIIGAGMGEKVLLSRGASSRYALYSKNDDVNNNSHIHNVPVDCVVVGIIDGEDIDFNLVK